jgi:SAM-dependent methyltransferase
MTMEEILEKWRLKEGNKKAGVELWDSMAQSFAEQALPDFTKNRFLRLLDAENMIDENFSVLDVGCGAGRYSLALASRCRNAVGVDFSPEMIRRAKDRAQKEAVHNVRFEVLDWHLAGVSERGFKKNFDLVIAHMTPAVQSADTFFKLSEASRGYCALSKPIRRVDPVSDAVRALAGIEEKRESSDLSVLYAFSLLFLQGKEVKITYEKERWDHKKTLREARALYVNRVKTYRDISAAEEQKIDEYLASLVKDGFIYETVDTTVATIYWHV